jgi:ABC-type transport system involved in multi-copper enzyme maturation permease subunit
MRGLLAKALREAGATSVALAAGLMTVEALLAWVLPSVLEDFSAQLLQLRFFRTMVQALLGSDLGQVIGPDSVVAIAWVHPVVLALSWTLAVALATRSPAGEVDRGTVDVLLGLPVSRWQVHAAEGAFLGLAGLAMTVLGLLGHRLGLLGLAPADRPGTAVLLAIACNFYCLYLAVAGLACAFSAASDRRGRAVAAVFAVLLASFLLNFLAVFWAPAKTIAFLSLLEYYRPLQVLREGASLADMAVLLGIAAVAWTAAGAWFARRDICTV